MNLRVIFPSKTDLTLCWLQRKVLNYELKCSTITEEMEGPFFSIHLCLKFMNLKQFAKFLEHNSKCLRAQVWQCLIFSLPTHKLMQASQEKGLNVSSYKALPNLCLLTRSAFWKGLRSAENLFASLKKNPNKLHLCIPGHTD